MPLSGRLGGFYGIISTELPSGHRAEEETADQFIKLQSGKFLLVSKLSFWLSVRFGKTCTDVLITCLVFWRLLSAASLSLLQEWGAAGSCNVLFLWAVSFPWSSPTPCSSLQATWRVQAKPVSPIGGWGQAFWLTPHQTRSQESFLKKNQGAERYGVVSGDLSASNTSVAAQKKQACLLGEAPSRHSKALENWSWKKFSQVKKNTEQTQGGYILKTKTYEHAKSPLRRFRVVASRTSQNFTSSAVFTGHSFLVAEIWLRKLWWRWSGDWWLLSIVISFDYHSNLWDRKRKRKRKLRGKKCLARGKAGIWTQICLTLKSVLSPVYFVISLEGNGTFGERDLLQSFH